MEREAELEILQAKLDSVLVDVEEIKNRINNLQEEKQAAMDRPFYTYNRCL